MHGAQASEAAQQLQEVQQAENHQHDHNPIVNGANPFAHPAEAELLPGGGPEMDGGGGVDGAQQVKGDS